jgi:acyl-coenzyme A synthetase/AMP-(fatty) acid ligase
MPCTAEMIEALAMRKPAAPALIEAPLALDYAGLDRAVRNCVAEFQRLGVRRGHKVAIGGPGFARQLIALLACEVLGAATASFLGEGDRDADGLFPLVDWVMAGVPQAVAPERFFRLDDAFIVPLLGRAPPPLPEPRAVLESHELQRITRTSGTSGQAKFIALSHAAHEAWVNGIADVSQFSATARLLIAGPFVMNAAFARSSRCLRNGGVVMVGEGRELPALAPTDIWGLPIHLERMLNEAGPGYRSPQPVAVVTVGGALHPDLRARLANAFGSIAINRYGSNEAGAICFEMDSGGVGLLCPGVEVRIVDGQGRALPPGDYGSIVVRGPLMADGYLGQPASVQAAFQDGWFHSADIGAIVGHRRLHLLGRQDELLNVAGIKTPAAKLEQGLRALALGECTALAVNGAGPTAAVGIAVALAPGVDREDAVARVTALVADAGVPVRLLFVEAMPRLPNGKPDRVELLRLFRGA